MSSSANGFIQENFLLQSSLAEKLYHDVAVKQPIIDYHSHLSPFEIATNRKYENIYQDLVE